MLGSYLFNKIAVGLNNSLDSASDPGTGYHDNVSVHAGEYFSDGGHQACLDAMGCLSISLPTKQYIRLVIDSFGRFMAKKTY